MTLDFRSMDDLCIRFAFFDAGTRAVYRTCISITLPSLGTPNASDLQSKKWTTSDIGCTENGPANKSDCTLRSSQIR